MGFASYNLRRVTWPVWAWAAELPNGSTARGYAIGKAAARSAARARIGRKQLRTARMRPAPQDDVRPPS